MMLVIIEKDEWVAEYVRMECCTFCGEHLKKIYWLNVQGNWEPYCSTLHMKMALDKAIDEMIIEAI